MSSTSISDEEIDPLLVDLAAIVWAPRAMIVPQVISHLNFSEHEAHLLLDHWRECLRCSFYIPQSWALH